jgi:ABC-type multidrug transport system ATPase subunit
VEPLVASSSLRVDVAGVPAIDGISLTTTGRWVLVLGAARALFEAASGLRAVAHGDLRTSGLPPLEAARRGLSACAPLDPPMPPRWTVRQYVMCSTRLAGQARALAETSANDAMERLELAAFESTRLGVAPTALRRAAVLAGALATGAALLLIEDPVAGLLPEGARSLARVVAKAIGDRKAVFFCARVPLESPIALAADEAVVVHGSQVVAQGAPAEIAADERTVALRLAGDIRAFTEALRRQGGQLLNSSGSSSPAHVSVQLGTLRTRDLFQIAESCNAVVLELRPLASAFA